MSVIEIKDFRKEYRDGWRRLLAVDSLSLSVEPGEIDGFLGPNGAGKTTTLKTLMGFMPATSGSVRVLGGDPGDWRSRARIGFLPENPTIYPYLNGRQALFFIGKMFSLDTAEIRRRTAELAGELGMDRELGLPIRKHSRGMLQRVGLAQALINDPDLLVLDEPMSGLDPIGRKMFREVIRRRRGRGKTVFFSSHILSDIEMICDRVGILHRGRIILEQPMADILSLPDGKRLEQIFMEKVGEAS